jgi:hypothetical protein
MFDVAREVHGRHAAAADLAVDLIGVAECALELVAEACQSRGGEGRPNVALGIETGTSPGERTPLEMRDAYGGMSDAPVPRRERPQETRVGGAHGGDRSGSTRHKDSAARRGGTRLHLNTTPDQTVRLSARRCGWGGSHNVVALESPTNSERGEDVGEATVVQRDRWHVGGE